MIGLDQVVCLHVKLRLGLVDERFYVETGRQEPKPAKYRNDVIEIAVNPAGDARVLVLDGR